MKLILSKSYYDNNQLYFLNFSTYGIIMQGYEIINWYDETVSKVYYINNEKISFEIKESTIKYYNI